MPATPAADALLVLLRWLHTLATVALLGWTVIYLLEPVGSDGAAFRRQRFKEVVELSLLVFLASGAVLSFDRLSKGAGNAYGVILAAKLVLVAAAYQFAFVWRRSGLRSAARSGWLVVAFTSGAALFAAILKGVFDSGVRSHL